ncbi:MAG: 16S rRNA (cytosine(1402)-N(4))-methyltransferase RsmH [Alphaproteobacteria bacterium]
MTSAALPASAAPEPATTQHVPVLLAETLSALEPRDGGLYVDGTFGGGGLTRALLSAARCQVLAIDRDPAAFARARHMAVRLGDRLIPLHGRFGDMAALCRRASPAAAERGVDGVALDLGFSSDQINTPDRGFSFQGDGPLDMRMDTSQGQTAAELLAAISEADLARLLHDLGEEPAARRIARAIVETRQRMPLRRTGELATIIRRAKGGSGKTDPATRSFQALRMAVNDELGEIERGLVSAESLLAPGGRLAVIAFHSLEDRLVKSFLHSRSAGAAGAPSRHQPPLSADQRRRPTLRLLHRRAIKPGEEEIRFNPRARSARLRTAERVAVSAGESD